MLENETVSAEEFAKALGRPVQYVKRNWRRLHKSKNFPAAIPGSDYRFPRLVVRQYLQTGGQAITETADGQDFIQSTNAALHDQMGIGQS